MSQFTIIQDLSLELRRRIHAALVNAPEAILGLTTPETDITLRLASQAPPDARLSLYLYHLQPEAMLRNQKFLPDAITGLRFPPLVTQLHYLITPLSDDEDTNHLMLGRILQFFHDEPFLDTIDGTPIGDSFGGSSPEMRIIWETLSVEELSHIWSALHADYRLSIAYIVRAVAIDTAQSVTEAKRAVDVHTVVGQKN